MEAPVTMTFSHLEGAGAILSAVRCHDKCHARAAHTRECRLRDNVPVFSRDSDVPRAGSGREDRLLDEGRLKQDLQPRAPDVEALLGRHTPQARHILRRLLGNEKLRPELIEGDGTKGYRFTGQFKVGRLLRGEAAEVLGTSEREKLAGRW